MTRDYGEMRGKVIENQRKWWIGNMGELSRINGYVYKIEIGTLGYNKGKHIMPPMSYERRQADEPFLKPNLKHKGMHQIYKVTALKFDIVN